MKLKPMIPDADTLIIKDIKEVLDGKSITSKSKLLKESIIFSKFIPGSKIVLYNIRGNLLIARIDTKLPRVGLRLAICRTVQGHKSPGVDMVAYKPLVKDCYERGDYVFNEERMKYYLYDGPAYISSKNNKSLFIN